MQVRLKKETQSCNLAQRLCVVSRTLKLIDHFIVCAFFNRLFVFGFGLHFFLVFLLFLIVIIVFSHCETRPLLSPKLQDWKAKVSPTLAGSVSTTQQHPWLAFTRRTRLLASARCKNYKNYNHGLLVLWSEYMLVNMRPEKCIPSLSAWWTKTNQIKLCLPAPWIYNSFKASSKVVSMDNLQTSNRTWTIFYEPMFENVFKHNNKFYDLGKKTLTLTLATHIIATTASQLPAVKPSQVFGSHNKPNFGVFNTSSVNTTIESPTSQRLSLTNIIIEKQRRKCKACSFETRLQKEGNTQFKVRTIQTTQKRCTWLSPHSWARLQSPMSSRSPLLPSHKLLQGFWNVCLLRAHFRVHPKLSHPASHTK